MILFDTHAHFPRESAGEHEAQLQRARDAGVSRLLAVGGSPDLDGGAEALTRHHAPHVALALGCDRALAASSGEADPAADVPAHMRRLRARVERLAVGGVALTAIGETGLDYSRRPSPAERAAQGALFAENVRLAAEWNLPCTIHSRDAEADTLAILAACGSTTLRETGRLGVIHCFTGDPVFAAAALELGLMIGVSGILTFQNAHALRATIGALPLDRLLVETDCPYLTPAPLRGRVNEPAHLVHTVNRLADLIGVSPEVCAGATTANACRLFAMGAA